MRIDKSFYKKVFFIVIPIIIQNTISNFVSLLDNIMVGQIGTDQMNAVSVSNQLFFVYHLCLWGAISGGGIFAAQFFGNGDHKGVRNAFRANLVLSISITIFAIAILLFCGDFFTSLFLHKTDFVGDVERTKFLAREYLCMMFFGLVPFGFTVVYSNTLRCTGQTSVPMKASVCAVFINLILNYVLIFGHFGMPEMGVKGAALATVVSRFVECAIIVLWTHTHKQRCQFIVGAYKTMKIPGALLRQIIAKGTPLALNETLWSMGLTFLNQSYSLRGLSVVAAINITSTISNLFNVFLFAIGDAISIIVGQLLGAGKNSEAKNSAKRLIILSACVCVVIGFVMACLRNSFPAIYKTESQVRFLAANFILITSCMMPILAVVHACYFTLRCGGKTIITFLFDSVFVWIFCANTAFWLTRFTDLPIVTIYLIVQSLDLIKAFIGITLVKKGIWIQNLTEV